ncbi:AAA family ATPase [Brunnivagina elsteri]|uniref:ATP-binding protein n=1 Tax=Brunnivagina elsteri CCALA 953 TaxID=987040 RepID=A0A2A2TFH9_9CYAN|nr:AAA family ATPase [Calothrix elsteri]PAX52395.1 ATP-binding protein [Calothrix elsteri CCALA 953]
MKVKRIAINSFRGIKELCLDFDSKEPTVILGINGVGKSSILDCLAILLSRFTSPIQYPTTSGRLFREEDVNSGCNETHNEITISVDNDEVSWSLTKVQKRRTKDTSSNLIELKKLIEDTQNQLRQNPQFNLPVFVHYAVNRAVIDIPLKVTKKPVIETVAAYEQALNGVQINFNNFFQWFRTLEDLENEERRDNPTFLNPQLDTVRQAIYSVLPDFSNLRIRRSPLRMTVIKDSREIIINQLSDGEKCLLAMVGDLAWRLAIANPSNPKPLQGNGVVLIDEVELHLHPKWQREVIPALTHTFPNCQLIVTTHSPQVVSHVKPEGIYILEKTDSGITIHHAESSFGRDSNRILEDLMRVPERPQEVKDSLRELFRCIDNNNLEGAKKIRQVLASEIGEDEPEFVRADVLIRRKEILNK